MSTWKISSLVSLRMIYQRLIFLLSNNYYLTCAIANALDPSEVDTFSALIVRIFSSVDRTLPYIKELIDYEFRANLHNKNAILRGNCPASKTESQFCRIIGNDYLKLVLGDIISEVVEDMDLNLEIDAMRLQQSGLSPDLVEENAEKLSGILRRILDRMTDPEILFQMPRELRAIAGFTGDYSKRFTPENFIGLIGGFLNLRYFSPGIVAPESFGVIENDVVPNQKSRRNLVLIGKILQSISNGTVNLSKEAYMVVMEDFIISQVSRMEEYLHEVASDIVSIEGSGPWSDLKHPLLEEEEIPMDSFIIEDMFNLHRILHRYRSKISSLLGEQNSFLLNTKQRESDRCFLEASGDPSKKINITEGFMTVGAILETIGEPPSSTISKKKITNNINSTDWEVSNFIYPGPADKEGNNIFYIILSRVDLSVLAAHADEVSEFIQHKILQHSEHANYSLVIDFSWVVDRDSISNTTFTTLSQVFTKLPRQMRKNCSQIYMLYPSANILGVFNYLKSFFSRKMDTRVVMLYQWDGLTRYIQSDRLQLPDETKDFISKAYRIIKVNNKGKHQRRILKFTKTSLLNVDPSTKAIKNEKFIEEINKIETTDDTTIVITFNPETRKKRQVDVRTYVCENRTERDEIMTDIFKVAYGLTINQEEKQEFRIKKIKKNKGLGETLKRVYKFTYDSILSIENDSIKKEMSLSSIENVLLVDSKDQAIYISIDFRDGRKLDLKCNSEKETTTLYSVISQMLARNTLDNARQVSEIRNAASSSLEGTGTPTGIRSRGL